MTQGQTTAQHHDTVSADTSISPFIPLTAHHLRFTVMAETEIRFYDFKGSALRGAMAGYLKRTYCPEWRAEKTDPLHQALCPVCQLLSYELAPESGGDIRRPFALQPPMTEQNDFAPGESFSFGLTLFGNQLAYLPYLVLAVRAAGEDGVGVRKVNRQRGRFRLERIDAVNPLTGATQAMLTPGAAMVQTATLPVTHDQVLATANRLAQQVQTHDNRLAVTFLTPTRLIQTGHTAKTAAFFPLMKQVVLRVLDLCAQHGEGRPAVVLKRDIYPAADAVEVVTDNTHWWDVAGYSGRLGREQRLGGLVGTALYRAETWEALLPWLVWGEIVQVGKNVVKGCGVYRLQGG
ncbi:MAG TPA: CRISPR system precrRNA processing endoribonuclease RAMP protein Cas6 [Chloroflexi bacterium]|nr:CRISPR system precrRNA processing endoribonuclease RAMP protein Cas6 [Chloroflexota bacterium]